MIIRSSTGVLLYDILIAEAAQFEQELMKSDQVTLSWNSDENTVIPVGAYIEYKGEKYSLLDPYTPVQKNEVEWAYTPVFKSETMRWSKVPFFFYTYGSDDTITGRETDWVLTDTPANFMSKVCESIKNETGALWTYAVDTSLSASETITFSSVDIFSALNSIANAFETEWWVDKTNKVLHLSKASFGEAVLLEVDSNIGVPTVQSQNGKEYYNRFYAFGSTRNIPQDYSGANVNNLTNKRLTLDPAVYPGGYKDTVEGLTPQTALSKILVFDEIYPHSDLEISDVRARLRYVLDENGNKVQVGTDDDGNPVYDQYAIWYFKISGFTFNNTTYDEESNPNGMLLPGLTMSVHFRSGALTDREFELAYHDAEEVKNDSADVTPFTVEAGDYEILYIKEGSYIIPAQTGIVPADGDDVTLFNIKMPDSYNAAAYDELEDALNEAIEEYTSDLNSYTSKSNPVAFNTSNPGLVVGRNVTYKNGSYTLSTRVTKIIKKLDYECEQTITFGNSVIKGSRQELKEDVVLANRNIDILTQLNQLSNQLTQSYNRVQQSMIEGFARIGNMWKFDPDDPDNTIYTPFNVYSNKEISAGGKGTGGDVPAGVTKLSALEDVSLSDLAVGQVLQYNGEKWVNANAAGGISSLTINLGTVSYKGVGTTDVVVNLPAYPTSMAWGSITDKPTTISEYGITDAYTKQTVDDKIAALQSAINAINSWFTLSDGTLITTYNIAADGEVSAGGQSSGGGGGTGGQIQTVYGYSSLGGTFSDNNKNDTFNAYTINTLASRIGVLENTPSGIASLTVNLGTVSYVGTGTTDVTVNLPAYPTTLPASDVYAWAKQPTKPSYTAAEVGALTQAAGDGRYALTTGTNASGTWPISITGNSATSTKLALQDTRSVNTAPFANGKGLIYHFKYNTADGLNDGGTYHSVLQFNQWEEHSGGLCKQLALTDGGNMWFRNASSATAWGAWKKLLDSSNYATTLDTRYVKKAGDTMTGRLVIDTSVSDLLHIDSSNNTETFIKVFRNGTQKAAFGYYDGLGSFMYNYVGGHYFELTDGGGLQLHKGGTLLGNIWHSGNDGSGSGLDADVLDGYQANDLMILGRSVNRLSGTTYSGYIPPLVLAMMRGAEQIENPTFLNGSNLGVYNHASDGSVTHTRVTDATAGNGSGYVLKIHSSESAEPGGGGFTFTTSKAYRQTTCVFRAKVPVGYTINFASNSVGSGGLTEQWLTDRAGTGKWEWYACTVYFGSSPSTSHFYYLTPAANVDWYLAYAQVFYNSEALYVGMQAQKADRLTTARTLWGQSFDGTANVSGSLTGVTTITASGLITANRGVQIGPTSGVRVSYVNAYLSLESAGNEMCIGGAAADGIFINYRKPSGGYAPAQFLWKAGSSSSWANFVLGSITANGNVTATGQVSAGNASDRRLKSDITTLTEGETAHVLSHLNPVSFTWNAKAEELSGGDKKGIARSFVADEFLSLLPNAGRKMWNDYDAIYTEQAVPYLVKGWQMHERRLSDHERRIQELEKENRELKRQLRRVA